MLVYRRIVSVCVQAQPAGANLLFLKHKGTRRASISPLDGMLVIAGLLQHLIRRYSFIHLGGDRCLAQELNIMTSAKAQT